MQIYVKVDVDTYEALQDLAEAAMGSISQQVRQAIRDYVNEHTHTSRRDGVTSPNLARAHEGL